MNLKRRCQWQRGPRRRSAAARLLRSWVRIPPGAWMFVCCECCVLLGIGLCDELITRPEESYRLWCVVVCDLEPQEWGGHDPRWVAAPQQKKKHFKQHNSREVFGAFRANCTLRNCWTPSIKFGDVKINLNQPRYITCLGAEIIQHFETYLLKLAIQ